MTVPRFCMSCGTALEPGSRFCPSCGAAVVGAQEAPVSAPACPNCGVLVTPGRRFCTSCGASLTGGPAAGHAAAQASASVAGIPREKLPMVLGAFAAGIIVVVLAVLIFGGGDGGNGGSAIGGGAASGDELGPGIGLAEFPEPAPVDLPEGDRLLGPNNKATAAAVRAYLADNGLDLTGIDLFVFPMAGTGESLLVIDANLEALTAMDTSGSSGDGDDEALAKLRDVPEVRAANITQVAMNLRGTDAQGAFVMTMTLPIDALDPNNPAYADLTDEQALEIFKVQITR